MTEERIQQLERTVTDLRLEYASDKASTASAIDHLTAAVTTLTSTVQEFRDTLNKGKGVVWLFGVLAAVIGGAISWVTTHFFRQI